MIRALDVLVVFVALTVAILVLLVVPEILYRSARLRVRALARERRLRRIEADRRIILGEEPLPPGVSLSDAYLYGARHDLTLEEAAWQIHRTRTLEVIRKATRRPRPGD